MILWQYLSGKVSKIKSILPVGVTENIKTVLSLQKGVVGHEKVAVREETTCGFTAHYQMARKEIIDMVYKNADLFLNEVTRLTY